MDNYGLISLLPVTVVIVSAIITKRAMEPLILGTIVAFVILEGTGFLGGYLDTLYATIGGNAYYIIIFGLFGMFAKLLEESNAISGFTRYGMKFANTKKKTVFLTWIIGMLTFLDNYFSILAAGVSTKQIADNNKMSREFFTYIINSIACVTCVLVPISLWGIFMSGQIELALGLEVGEGLGMIIKSIPFIFFAFVSAIFVLLYGFKIIPTFGPMKKAELRAEGGQLLPDACMAAEAQKAEGEETKEEEGKLINFLVPMIAVIGVTLWTTDLLLGLVAANVAAIVIYIAQRIITPSQALDTIPQGFMDMFVVTGIVISAFALQAANEMLGLAPFVVDSVAPYMSPALLPAIAFLLLLGLGFVTGSFWGMMAVCFPIILPLAEGLGGNIYLAIGAIIAGACAASSTCFYGDSATLSCGVTKIRNADFLSVVNPMIVPPIVITFILFLVAGFVL